MLTQEQNTKLTALNTKLTTGVKLTDAEANELLTLMNVNTASMRAVRDAAAKSGILIGSDADTATITQLAEDFYWQNEGNLSWYAYRMEVIGAKYNEMAVKLKWTICTDIADLPKLIAAIPTMYQGAVQVGRSKAAARYTNAWSKELTKLALLRATGQTLNKPKPPTA